MGQKIAFIMSSKDNTIYCSCCGTEKMAEVIGDKLVIKDRRHGEKHVVVLSVKDLLDKMGNKVYALSNR